MLKVRIKKEASASVVSGRKSKPKMAAVKIFKEVEKNSAIAKEHN